ncbi:hypothetical protein [Streptomyces olivaceoviridis]|uniref:hypothetical protein n=1 Tax=Streptomyces olivaceoviridis TaxID=1921 RepID=UPI0036C3A0DC
MGADSRIRTSVEEHWRASERGDVEAEHALYAADAMLDCPQSGERFRGRGTIAAQRGGHPADRRSTLLRITGHAHVWVSECVITYDGAPAYPVIPPADATGVIARRASARTLPSHGAR